MQSEPGGQFDADFNPPTAVSPGIERRGIGGNAKLTVDDRHHPSSDAALGRHAHAVGPFP